MSANKTLRNIVLASALALNATGCSVDYSQYRYDGKIGEDKVKFTEDRNLIFKFRNGNTLNVTKPDGRVITYIDWLGNDLKLEYVEIKKNGITTQYASGDEVGKIVLEKAQKQFDNYMQQIKIFNINQGLVNLE